MNDLMNWFSSDEPVDETDDEMVDEEELTDEEEQLKREKRKQELNENFVYFNVPSNILDVELTKSEWWIYLTHCRAVGRQQDRHSIAGVTAVRKNFKRDFSEPLYDKKMEVLEKKGVIKRKKKKEDDKFRFYRTDEKIEIVKPEGYNYIQLPRELIDEKLLVNLNSELIRDIITLYKYYNVFKWACIDPDYFRVTYKDLDYQKDPYEIYGHGYSKVVYGKPAYLIQDPNKDKGYTITAYKELEFINDTKLQELINTGLFKLVPLLHMVDKDDEDIEYLKGEIYKGYMSSKPNKYIWHLSETPTKYPIITWALKPFYRSKTPEFNKFVKEVEQPHIKRQKRIYINFDYATESHEKKRELIRTSNYSELWEELTKTDYDSIIDDLLEELTMNESIETLTYKLESLMIQEDYEKHRITEYNSNNLTESGYPTRKTTNPKLKITQSQINEIRYEIEELIELEDILINLIPTHVYRFLGEKIKELEEMYY